MFKDTEVTSYTIASDNVLNQRLLFAYFQAANMVKGDMLEVGCGVGKGAEVFSNVCKNYTAIDKNDKLIAHHSKKYPAYTFINSVVPPFVGLDSNSFDFVVSLQVIEHIADDHNFLKEIYRVMKSGAKAVISTPNIKLSLTRNPWHVKEYTAIELKTLLELADAIGQKLIICHYPHILLSGILLNTVCLPTYIKLCKESYLIHTKQ